MLLLERARGRNRGEKRLRVGMKRFLVDALRVAELDHLAEVHDGDAVGDVLDDAQVVRDEDVRQAKLALEPAEEVEHLSLDGHVERGNRLVAYEQLRLKRKRAGNVDALALAARELMRVAVHVLGVEADKFHQLANASLALLRIGLRLVDNHRLFDDLCAGLARIERRVGILEDHLHTAALATGAVFLEVERLTFERDGSACRLMKANEAASQSRLAAAGLADDAEGLASVHLEVHARECMQVLGLLADLVGADLEVLRQVADLQNDIRVGRRYRIARFRDRLGCSRLLIGVDAHYLPPFTRSRCASSVCLWQATRCPGSTSMSSGTSLLQMSCA